MGRLLCLLDGCDRELLCTTAGVLINLMADWDKRLAFKQDGGAGRLINILSKYGEGDWQLATLVCQALWNYCSETTDLYSAFTVEEMNSLFGLLADSLDEERLFGVKEGTEVNETIASSAGYQIWEEFAGAATNLLEKMETFMDTVEPLEILSLNEERKEYERPFRDRAPHGREAELSGGERTHYVTPTPIPLEPPPRGTLDDSSSSSRKPSTPAQWFQTISRDRARARGSIEPNTLLKKETIQLAQNHSGCHPTYTSTQNHSDCHPTYPSTQNHLGCHPTYPCAKNPAGCQLPPSPRHSLLHEPSPNAFIVSP
uniref:Uncharacterized protein n=1 Tax=Timema douglasi TaxID=61478 RepID=A0A7R8VFH5_TIMDO|nr:unnamed protein product [Timema douglasi]